MAAASLGHAPDPALCSLAVVSDPGQAPGSSRQPAAGSQAGHWVPRLGGVAPAGNSWLCPALYRFRIPVATSVSLAKGNG